MLTTMMPEDIIQFRYKLPGILLCWKTNTAVITQHFDQIHGTEANLRSQDCKKEPKTSESISEETKYKSLPLRDHVDQLSGRILLHLAQFYSNTERGLY